MRKAFLITIVNANVIALGGAIYSIYRTGKVAEGLGLLVIGLLGTAFGGKTGQKFAEKNGTTVNNITNK